MKHWFFYKKRHYILVVILLIFFLSLPSLSIFFYSFSKIAKFTICNSFAISKTNFFFEFRGLFFLCFTGYYSSSKGKKFLEWALILPFLFPPYILAYLYKIFLNILFLREFFFLAKSSGKNSAKNYIPKADGGCCL